MSLLSPSYKIRLPVVRKARLELKAMRFCSLLTLYQGDRTSYLVVDLIDGQLSR
jgi:hypothetical protein